MSELGVVCLLGQFVRRAKRELRETLGQVIRARHACPRHEQGDEADVALERCDDFHDDEVGRIVESAPPGIVLSAQPVLADHSDQHVTRGERIMDPVAEVATALDARVQEDPARAELRAQSVSQPDRVRRAVLVTV